ncbi:MAG: cytidine deaminase [Defluviitaleaceae bacterium]|nr:cytidine deaminase [Defluviitaleaceae bacterium]
MENLKEEKLTSQDLINIAIEQTKKSYSPYSNFEVGCALQTKNGNIYTGSNIENAAFSPTLCAERVAIAAAVHNGEKEFKAIAIAGFKKGEEKGHTFPCGVCRQTLAEFCDKDFKLIIAKNKNGEHTEHTFEELFPHSFGKNNL